MGQQGTMAIWDGSNWIAQNRITKKDLFAFGHYSGGGGVEIVNWLEVVR